MPVKPDEIADNYPDDYTINAMISVIDQSLRHHHFAIDIENRWDKPEILEQINKIYSDAGWNLTYYPCKRVTRYKDQPSRLITKTLVFTPKTPSKRRNPWLHR